MTAAISQETLSEQVAGYALGLQYEAIPPEVLDRTKQLFLDFLGVTLGGRSLAEAGPALIQGASCLAGGATGPCTVAGEPQCYPPYYAAFANAALAHAMDFDDTHRDAVMHQGTPLFAALLAGSEVAESSGREFLTAAVAGYEIGGRLGLAHGNRVHLRGFHPTATTGIFAVVAAAGRLGGFDEGTIRNALGLALSMSAGCQQFSESGGDNKPVQVGLAAHNALYCLVLAKAGVRGTGLPLEGRFGYYATYATEGSDLGGLSFDGPPAQALQVAVKPYPCCRCSHAAIDAVTLLTAREDLMPEEIEAIEIAIPPVGYQLVGQQPDLKRRPPTVVDAQFSIYFAAASAALDRAYSWDSYQKLTDPRLHRLMDRVSVSPSEDIEGMGAKVALVSTKGSWDLAVAFPKGEPEVPLGWREVEAKFRSLAGQGLDPGRIEALIGRVHELDKLARVGELAALLRPSL